MIVEQDEIQVGQYVLTTQQRNELEYFQSRFGVSDDEAQIIIGSIRHLGTSLDYRSMKVTKKILDAARAKKDEMEAKEQQELNDLREKQAVWQFSQNHPEVKLSGPTAESYQRWAAKNGVTTFSLQALEAWFATCRAEVLPPAPSPVVVSPTPDPDPSVLEPLPQNLQRLEHIQTRRDVWNCPPALFKFGMKFKEFVDRVNRIEREKR
jgi:hypothetical protein